MVIYQKFLIVVISLILFLLSSIFTLNYYIDPGNQFFRSQAFETKLANYLLANKKVMIRSNYDARLLKKIMLANIKTRPDVLILGSSRVMLINHDLFKTNSFYNAWVPSGATIQDDIALFYIFQKRGWKPKTVLICLDTWILARNNGKEAWKVFLPEFLSAKKLLLNDNKTPHFYERWSEPFIKYSQLLSVDYLIASLKKMNEWHQAKKSHRSIEDVLVSTNANDCPSCDTEHPDGSRTQSKKKELTTPEEADLLGRKSIPHTQYNNSYTELDPEYTNYFESFINYLLSQDINVILYLPPYEPAAYDEILKDTNYKMIKLSELYFKKIASNYHLKIIGSYNPNQLGLKSDDFIDDLHLKKKGLEKIFNKKNMLLNV